MENRKNLEYRVGIFVSIGAFFFLLTIYILGGDRALFTAYYRLNIKFPSVTGIAKGSVVHLQGIKVGNVEEVFFDNSAIIIVRLKIEKSYHKLLTKGSLAGVRTQGALGDKYIYLAAGSPTEPELQDNEFLDREPDSDIMSIISSKGSDVNKIFDVIDELHKFSVALNANGRSSTIMQNMADSSVLMKQTMNDLRQITTSLAGKSEQDNKLKQSLTHLTSILEKVDNGTGTLGELINDPSLYQDLQRIVGGQKRTKYLKGLIRSNIESTEGQ